MAFRLLLDEMTEAALADYCHNLGHDVERVVDVPGLGPGTNDTNVLVYAERENRLVVTYDDDFLTGEALARVGVLFQPDDRTPPFETANIIDTIATHVEQQDIVDCDEPFHLTAAWS